MLKFKIIFAFLFCVPFSLSAQDVSEIDKIVSESDEESSLITLKIKGKEIEKVSKFEAHSTFIQLTINNAQSKEIGVFFEGNSPYIRKIAMFKIDHETIGLRIFPSQEPMTLMSSLTSQVLKDRIMIYLDHKSIPPPLTGIPSADEVVESVKVRKDIADPAKNITKESPKGDMSQEFNLPASEFKESETLSLKDRLVYIAVFSAIMIIGFLAMIFLKGLSKRKSSKNSLEEKVAMKTLASYPISAKQRLTLIEIGKQKLLLGISPDNINYLTEIDRKDEVNPVAYEKPKKIISPELPSGAVKAYRGASSPQSHHKNILEPNRTKTRYHEPQEERSIQNEKADKSSGETRGDQKSIEDVTNLIRRKLKNLPNI